MSEFQLLVDGLRANAALAAGAPRHLVAAGIGSDPRTFAKAWAGNDPAPVARALTRYGVAFAPTVFHDSNLLHSGPSIARHRLLKAHGSRADEAALRQHEAERRAERQRERERAETERRERADRQRRDLLLKAQRTEQAQRRELARQYKAARAQLLKDAKQGNALQIGEREAQLARIGNRLHRLGIV
jgi:hypothetical protein